MKENKKFFIWGIVVTLLIAAFSIYYVVSNQCKVDGTQICYDGSTSRFKIEEEVHLKVQVESEAMGEYLVNKWNELYPEQEGAIEYVVLKPLKLRDLADDLPADIIITNIHDAAYVLDDMLILNNDVDKYILNKIPVGLQDAINDKGITFIPNSIKGWSFVYNKTLAEEIGIDLTDENQDGLPDSFETWEKLFELEPKIHEYVDYLFPLTFVDQLSFYPFLTGSKWRLNFTHKGSDPGFDHPEFLKGLSLIKDFSKVKLNKQLETQTAESLEWAYDTSILNRNTVFTMVSDWMLFDYVTAKSDDEYVYAPFPKYADNYLAPIGYVDGYMIQKEVEYPSASAEVLRILRDKEAAPHYKSNDDKVFIYDAGYLDELEIDIKLKNKIRSLSYSDTEPVFVLENNPSILARSILYDLDFMPVIRDLFDGKITEEQAQEKIVELSNAWHESKMPIEETEE